MSPSAPAVVMPAMPPPTTTAACVSGTSILNSGSSMRARATDILTRSRALSVALACSRLCTQLAWSRMLAISKRNGLRPASRRVSWKMGSWVRGVQLATTTRLSWCSSIFSRISERLSLEHEYSVSVAYSTPGSVMRVLGDVLDVDHAGDVAAAVADEDADARLLAG